MTPEKATCQIPPPGWYCTREAGHDGPCAALPNLTAFTRAVAEEREACAKLVEFMMSADYTAEKGGGHGAPADAAEIAGAIRCGHRAG